jgi:DNA-directed RNA polymerase subunit beta
MSLTFTGKKRIRKSFGRIPEVIRMPNLIEVQKSSYNQFLQKSIPHEERGLDEGMHGVFHSVFPVRDFSDRAVLEYVSFVFEPPKFDEEECQQRDITYAAPLKVKMRLVVFDVDDDTGARSVKDIKEQDVSP